MTFGTVTDGMVLLDLDGVFADLHVRLAEVHGKRLEDLIPGEWLLEKSWGLTGEQLWGHPAIRQIDFWADLPKTPWADELLALVTEFVPVERQCVLTKPLPSDPFSAAGKMRWIERHLPEHYRLHNYLIGGGKRFCASMDRVLIDDADHNISDFYGCGGEPILFPRVWNANHALESAKLDYVRGQLTRLREERVII